MRPYRARSWQFRFTLGAGAESLLPNLLHLLIGYGAPMVAGLRKCL
ncbi:hypothetical protein PMI07_002548 [Rhizobium sp. CF080]|nr:hypothetical protein PMI07_002548 [Rhizobium sp. CF080]